MSDITYPEIAQESAPAISSDTQAAIGADAQLQSEPPMATGSPLTAQYDDSQAHPADLRAADSQGSRERPREVDFLADIEVQAAVELGRTILPIGEVLKLTPGSVVHLDKMLGEPVDLMIKGRLIARGEVVVVDDKFGLRITEITSRRGG